MRPLLPLLPVLLLPLLLVLVAGDAGWWRSDWWSGSMRAQIERLSPPPPLADLAPPECLAALAASGAVYDRIADFETGPGCRVDAAVRVHRLAGVALSTPFVASCPLALALQRHADTRIQPAAQRLLGSDITRIEHVGSFACRRIRGRPNGPLSQHAYARALDITGFVLTDGRLITLAADWNAGARQAPDAAGRFLRAVAARRGMFTSVITPDHDARHRDHIHFGLRPAR
jgi:hypothetical protein